MLLGTFSSTFPFARVFVVQLRPLSGGFSLLGGLHCGSCWPVFVRNFWMDTGHLHTLRPIFHLQVSSSEHGAWHCLFVPGFLFSHNLLCNSLLLLNLQVFVEVENRCHCPWLLMGELPEPASTTIDSPSELPCVGDSNVHIAQRTVCVTQNNGSRSTWNILCEGLMVSPEISQH